MLAGQAGKDETITDASGRIAQANQENPNPASRETIATQVARILEALKGASWKVVEATVAELVKERDAAQQTSVAQAQEIDRLKRELEAAKNDAQRQAYLGVVRVFAVIGGALTLAGVLVFLWSTYKRAGIMLAVAGPVVGGSGLLWGKPWFVLTIGVGIILVGVAVGLRYAWGVLDANHDGKLDFLQKPKS